MSISKAWQHVSALLELAPPPGLPGVDLSPEERAAWETDCSIVQGLAEPGSSWAFTGTVLKEQLQEELRAEVTPVTTDDEWLQTWCATYARSHEPARRQYRVGCAVALLEFLAANASITKAGLRAARVALRARVDGRCHQTSVLLFGLPATTNTAPQAVARVLGTKSNYLPVENPTLSADMFLGLRSPYWRPNMTWCQVVELSLQAEAIPRPELRALSSNQVWEELVAEKEASDQRRWRIGCVAAVIDAYHDPLPQRAASLQQRCERYFEPQTYWGPLGPAWPYQRDDGSSVDGSAFGLVQCKKVRAAVYLDPDLQIYPADDARLLGALAWVLRAHAMEQCPGYYRRARFTRCATPYLDVALQGSQALGAHWYRFGTPLHLALRHAEPDVQHAVAQRWQDPQVPDDELVTLPLLVWLLIGGEPPAGVGLVDAVRAPPGLLTGDDISNYAPIELAQRKLAYASLDALRAGQVLEYEENQLGAITRVPRPLQPQVDMDRQNQAILLVTALPEALLPSYLTLTLRIQESATVAVRWSPKTRLPTPVAPTHLHSYAPTRLVRRARSRAQAHALTWFLDRQEELYGATPAPAGLLGDVSAVASDAERVAATTVLALLIQAQTPSQGRGSAGLALRRLVHQALVDAGAEAAWELVVSNQKYHTQEESHNIWETRHGAAWARQAAVFQVVEVHGELRQQVAEGFTAPPAPGDLDMALQVITAYWPPLREKEETDDSFVGLAHAVAALQALATLPRPAWEATMELTPGLQTVLVHLRNLAPWREATAPLWSWLFDVRCPVVNPLPWLWPRPQRPLLSLSEGVNILSPKGGSPTVIASEPALFSPSSPPLPAPEALTPTEVYLGHPPDEMPAPARVSPYASTHVYTPTPTPAPPRLSPAPEALTPTEVYLEHPPEEMPAPAPLSPYASTRVYTPTPTRVLPSYPLPTQVDHMASVPLHELHRALLDLPLHVALAELLDGTPLAFVDDPTSQRGACICRIPLAELQTRRDVVAALVGLPGLAGSSVWWHLAYDFQDSLPKNKGLLAPALDRLESEVFAPLGGKRATDKVEHRWPGSYAYAVVVPEGPPSLSTQSFQTCQSSLHVLAALFHSPHGHQHLRKWRDAPTAAAALLLAAESLWPALQDLPPPPKPLAYQELRTLTYEVRLHLCHQLRAAWHAQNWRDLTDLLRPEVDSLIQVVGSPPKLVPEPTRDALRRLAVLVGQVEAWCELTPALATSAQNGQGDAPRRAQEQWETTTAALEAVVLSLTDEQAQAQKRLVVDPPEYPLLVEAAALQRPPGAQRNQQLVDVVLDLVATSRRAQTQGATLAQIQSEILATDPRRHRAVIEAYEELERHMPDAVSELPEKWLRCEALPWLQQRANPQYTAFVQGPVRALWGAEGLDRLLPLTDHEEIEESSEELGARLDREHLVVLGRRLFDAVRALGSGPGAANWSATIDAWRRALQRRAPRSSTRTERQVLAVHEKHGPACLACAVDRLGLRAEEVDTTWEEAQEYIQAARVAKERFGVGSGHWTPTLQSKVRNQRKISDYDKVEDPGVARWLLDSKGHIRSLFGPTLPSRRAPALREAREDAEAVAEEAVEEEKEAFDEAEAEAAVEEEAPEGTLEDPRDGNLGDLWGEGEDFGLGVAEEDPTYEEGFAPPTTDWEGTAGGQVGEDTRDSETMGLPQEPEEEELPKSRPPSRKQVPPPAVTDRRLLPEAYGHFEVLLEAAYQRVCQQLRATLAGPEHSVGAQAAKLEIETNQPWLTHLPGLLPTFPGTTASFRAWLLAVFTALASRRLPSSLAQRSPDDRFAVLLRVLLVLDWQTTKRRLWELHRAVLHGAGAGPPTLFALVSKLQHRDDPPPVPVVRRSPDPGLFGGAALDIWRAGTAEDTRWRMGGGWYVVGGALCPRPADALTGPALALDHAHPFHGIALVFAATLHRRTNTLLLRLTAEDASINEVLLEGSSLTLRGWPFNLPRLWLRGRPYEGKRVDVAGAPQLLVVTTALGAAPWTAVECLPLHGGAPPRGVRLYMAAHLQAPVAKEEIQITDAWLQSLHLR